MDMYRHRITLKPGQVVREDQPCHWMLDVDPSGIEKLLEVFEQYLPSSNKPLVKAYRDLIIPDTRTAQIQFPNGDMDWYKFAVKEFVTKGYADLFVTAVLGGRVYGYRDIEITIWHPFGPGVSLSHKGCDYRHECKGDVHLLREHTFGIEREGQWIGFIDTYEHTPLDRCESRDDRERKLKGFRQEEEKHSYHEYELLGAIKEIQRYLPALRKGTIYRRHSGSAKRQEEVEIGNFLNGSCLDKFLTKIIG
jgi:hypothetical protein